MIKTVITVDGSIVAPVFTAAEAGGKEYFSGTDSDGAYVACRLGNYPSAELYGWYIKVSPEDVVLIKKYNWCGKVSGSGIEVRRRESVQGKQIIFQLGQELWFRMRGEKMSRVYRLGHLLDFRRTNLSSSLDGSGCRGITCHESKKFWQVQIVIMGKCIYIGSAKSPVEGYRMYNRFLREQKLAYPTDVQIQSMPYNPIDPLF